MGGAVFTIARRKLQEKKNALVHKADDHAEEQNTGDITMGGW